MSSSWQLQEAKNKLSEVVDHALKEGPQEITRRGKKTAVILSAKDYMRLKRKKGNLSTFFRGSPLKGFSLDRAKDYPREVDV